jgi:hypothetical protein
VLAKSRRTLTANKRIGFNGASQTKKNDADEAVGRQRDSDAERNFRAPTGSLISQPANKQPRVAAVSAAGVRVCLV